MALKGWEFWVMAQIGLELVLISLLLLFLWRFRTMAQKLRMAREEEKQATASLARFSDQMAQLEKRRLALEEIIARLTEKANILREQNISPRPPARGSALRLQVQELHLKGLSAAEIAQQLGLHPTEVKMALDLARLRAE